MMKRTYIYATVMLSCLAQTHSTPAATSYSGDRSAWRTAAGGGTGDVTDNYNDVVNDINTLSPALDRGPYSIDDTSINPSSYLDGIGDDGGSPAFTNVNGTSYLYVYTDTGSGTFILSELSLLFDQPITAIGFDHQPFGGDSSNVVTIQGSNNEEVDFPLSPNQQPVFTGVVFDSPVDSVRFYYFGNEASRFGLDDLEAYSVPEPSSLALLGLGGLAMSRRRRY